MALAWVVLVSPSGTVTWTGGATSATLMVTVSPFLTRESGAGSVEITVPGGVAGHLLDLGDVEPVGPQGGRGHGGLLADDVGQVERGVAPEVAEVAAEEEPGDQPGYSRITRAMA